MHGHTKKGTRVRQHELPHTNHMAHITRVHGYSRDFRERAHSDTLINILIRNCCTSKDFPWGKKFHCIHEHKSSHTTVHGHEKT